MGPNWYIEIQNRRIAREVREGKENFDFNHQRELSPTKQKYKQREVSPTKQKHNHRELSPTKQQKSSSTTAPVEYKKNRIQQQQNTAHRDESPVELRKKKRTPSPRKTSARRYFYRKFMILILKNRKVLSLSYSFSLYIYYLHTIYV